MEKQASLADPFGALTYGVTAVGGCDYCVNRESGMRIGRPFGEADAFVLAQPSDYADPDVLPGVKRLLARCNEISHT